MSDSQACCAHSRVVSKHTDNANGTRSDYWECDYGCGQKFHPAPREQELKQASPTPISDAASMPVEAILNSTASCMTQFVPFEVAEKLEQEVGKLSQTNSPVFNIIRYQRAERNITLLIAELKGAMLGLSAHPTEPYDGFCISAKSREKLDCINEMIKRYEQL